MSLEKIGEGQFKAVAPSGAPFEIVLPISIANGSISGGATTITIPVGSVESEPLTVIRTPGSTFAVTVDIGTLPGLPSDHSGYALAKSDDLPIVFTELGGAVFTPVPVCDRTPQVRDKIVELSPVSTCSAVTEAHLAAITELILGSQQIRTLKVGDFDGLNALTRLYLPYNQLTSLPAGIFDGLNALTRLELERNQLTSLPAGIFDGLTNLTEIDLRSNQLTNLPAGIFDGLNSLKTLRLHSNQLTSLPAGIFDGLNVLTLLNLLNNSVDPLPLAVSLEKIGEDQFKAVAPTGAPFDIVLPLRVANGSISGGTTTITIPIGSVESAPLTVTRTPGTTFAVTVDIGTLPGVPRSGHGGYALVKSADLPLEIFSLWAGGITPVCERTLQVQTAILGVLQLQTPSPSTCGEVTETHLATSITSLFLNGQSITTQGNRIIS